jgi:hypothetical protein
MRGAPGRVRGVAVFALGLSLGLAGSIAYASIPGTGGVISACLSNGSAFGQRVVTILDTAQSALCQTNQTLVTWSHAGPAGPAGAAQLYTLTVTNAQVGGIITSTPTGISCGTTCSRSFPVGTSVTLSPAPNANFSFAGWSGACSGTAACTVAMNADATVTAAFQPQLHMTIGFGSHVSSCTFLTCQSVPGSGLVTSSPPGVSCGGVGPNSVNCPVPSFALGSTVVLTANPTNGSTFAGWGGECSTSGSATTCSVVMDGPKSVMATFD